MLEDEVASLGLLGLLRARVRALHFMCLSVPLSSSFMLLGERAFVFCSCVPSRVFLALGLDHDRWSEYIACGLPRCHTRASRIVLLVGFVDLFFFARWGVFMLGYPVVDISPPPGCPLLECVHLLVAVTGSRSRRLGSALDLYLLLSRSGVSLSLLLLRS